MSPTDKNLDRFDSIQRARRGSYIILILPDHVSLGHKWVPVKINGIDPIFLFSILLDHVPSGGTSGYQLEWLGTIGTKVFYLFPSVFRNTIRYVVCVRSKLWLVSSSNLRYLFLFRSVTQPVERIVSNRKTLSSHSHFDVS